MDDLLNIAKRTMENFNPATDKVDDFEKLPDGEYQCLLEEVTARKSEKGTNWISFKFSIMEALDQVDVDYTNRYLFVNYFFTDKSIERSIKSISKLAYEFGYELAPDAFISYESLAKTLNSMAGNQAIVKQTTGKNDFTNYKVTPIQ